MPQFITQKDLAIATGLNQSTVSLALREDSRISEETRQLVLKTSRKLGYRKDPMLSALAATRNKNKTGSHQGTIAWLKWPKLNNPANYSHSACEDYSTKTFNTAKARALHLGYKLEAFNIPATEREQHRLSNILYNRGITGCLLPPISIRTEAPKMNWNHFAVATFGWQVTDLRFNSVSITHYENAIEMVRNLSTLGYQRIGGVITKDENNKLHFFKWAHGIDMTASTRRIKHPIPTLRLTAHNSKQRKTFTQWIHKYEPQCICTSMVDLEFIQDTLKSLKLKVPQDIGIALMDRPEGERYYSGINEHANHAGAAAVEILIGDIRQRALGVPKIRRIVSLEGTWTKSLSTPTLKSKQ